jgi:hypothetical protein
MRLLAVEVSRVLGWDDERAAIYWERITGRAVPVGDHPKRAATISAREAAAFAAMWDLPRFGRVWRPVVFDGLVATAGGLVAVVQFPDRVDLIDVTGAGCVDRVLEHGRPVSIVDIDHYRAMFNEDR